MKLTTHLLPVLCALLTLPAAAFAQTSSATTDPVGFVTLNINGTGGNAPSALTFLGLSMTRPVAFEGTVSTVSGTTIVCTGATWADGAFNGTNGPYFVEVTSGPLAGMMTDIVNTVAATQSLVLISPISGLTGGETIKVRPHWTLPAVFGATNSAGLGGSGSVAGADEILVYDPVGQAYQTYYYKTTTYLGGAGWRTSANADASQVPLYIDEGILIVRKQPAPLSVVLTGAVKTGPTLIPISQGLNFVSNVYPAAGPSLGTLGASQLFTGSATTGLAGSGSPAAADLVQFYSFNSAAPSQSTYTTYYYKTTTYLGGAGWRDSANDNATSVALPIGQCLIINRQATGGFLWQIPQPF
jgi:uncharacterized protein (TIGR02597 family)